MGVSVIQNGVVASVIIAGLAGNNTGKVDLSTVVLLTGDQNISGIKTFNTGIITTNLFGLQVDITVPNISSGSLVGFSPQGYADGNLRSGSGFYQFNVYGYTHTPTGQVFSASPKIISGTTTGFGLANSYLLIGSWSAISGVDGYRVLIARDTYTNSSGSQYFDTTSTSFYIGDVDSGINFDSNSYQIYQNGYTTTPSIYTFYDNILLRDSLEIRGNAPYIVIGSEDAYITSGALMAVGKNARALNKQAIALTEDSQALGPWSLAWGYGASAGGWSACALGEDAIAGGVMSYALGAGAEADGAFSFALGRGAAANYTGSFCLAPIDTYTATDSAPFQFVANFQGGYFFQGGYVGINTTTPSYTLDVNGTGNFSSGLFISGNNISTYFYPKNSNPSGFITGVNLTPYATTSSLTGYVQTNSTGIFITTGQTGAFGGSGGSFAVSTWSSLTFGTTTNWTAQANTYEDRKILYLTGNTTLNISGLYNGWAGMLQAIQSGSQVGSGFNISLPASTKVVNNGSGKVFMTSGSGAMDILGMSYDGSNLFVNYGNRYS